MGGSGEGEGGEMGGGERGVLRAGFLESLLVPGKEKKGPTLALAPFGLG